MQPLHSWWGHIVPLIYLMACRMLAPNTWPLQALRVDTVMHARRRQAICFQTLSSHLSLQTTFWIQVYQLYLVIACTRVQACDPLIQLWVFEFISYLCSRLTDLNHGVEVILSPITCQNYLTNAPMPTSRILPSLTLGEVHIPSLSNFNADKVDPKIL